MAFCWSVTNLPEVTRYQLPIAQQGEGLCASSPPRAGIWLGWTCWSGACCHDHSKFTCVASLLAQKTSFPCHGSASASRTLPSFSAMIPEPWEERHYTLYYKCVRINPVWCRTFTLFGSLSPFSFFFFFLVSACYTLSNNIAVIISLQNFMPSVEAMRRKGKDWRSFLC